ncbi:hypothetical protein L917_19732 [Phytophthora nicotianae]|uniref:PiggyBac transposable element-derived protein domain-containing protein n=1 Tax=Phytophthora nicotianae TaxID=4792 RepID=W2K576_PHYNI|nr:hypothetical protein L917_19732 [Phytophthora nicotianae]
MGGVDVDGQLRFQSGALQKKYYKNRFLGSVDLAYINALIVFNHARTAANQAKLSHITFMTQLHLELYQISPRDWEELVSSPDPNFTPTKQRVAAAARHMPIQAEDKRKDNTAGSTKGRQRARQVCSVLKEKVTDGDTSFQCSNSEFKTIDQKTGETKASPVYLCNKVKHAFNGQARTCFEIWHGCWQNGKLKPNRDMRAARWLFAKKGEFLMIVLTSNLPQDTFKLAVYFANITAEDTLRVTHAKLIPKQYFF